VVHNKQGVTTLAVTGTIGSGKSTVGTILQDLSVPVIDADQLVHELLASDQETQNLVKARFGEKVVISQGAFAGQIDRKALGRIIFSDDKARMDLEKIIHPRVRQACLKKINEYAAKPTVKVIAVLVPLLFEANLAREYDQTWAVVTATDILKDRLRKRDGFSEAQLSQRIASQWPQERKAALADKIIDNSQDIAHTKTQVVALLDQLKSASPDL
jgi:dephospho-CoA kinase